MKGAVALVTGAASGIGRGLVAALAREGAMLAVTDLDLAGARSVAAALAASGGRALPLQLDVRDAAAWEVALDRIEAELGPLQILCSNAGVGGSKLPMEETEWQGWQWTLDVNLNGTFHALRTCLPRMRRHGRQAHIVCTASLGGLLVVEGNGAYSASKAAVIALCEAVRLEVAGTAIGVSVLCPALVATKLLENRHRLAPPSVPIGDFGPELEAAMKAGLDPARVAEIVLHGIRDNRFWLFTHPELKPFVARRSQEMLASM